MTDDIGLGVVTIIAVTFMVLGLGFIVIKASTTQLHDAHWECTESALIDGKAECIKYERRKGVKK